MKKVYIASLAAGLALLVRIMHSRNNPSVDPLQPADQRQNPPGNFALVFKAGFEEYKEHLRDDLKLFNLPGENNPDWMSVGNPTAHFTADPLDPDNRVVAIPLNYSDPINYRTEIKLVKISQFELNGVYRIQFSILIPTSWQKDELADLIMQVHGQKDTGEFSRNPPISLLIENDQLKLVVRGDRNAKTRTNIFTKQHFYTEPTRDYIVGPIERGKWTKIRIEFLNRHGPDGWLHLWLNDELAVQDKGANAYNDRKGGYLSLGNYKYPWRNKKPIATNSRLHYIDDVEIYSIPHSTAAELKME